MSMAAISKLVENSLKPNIETQIEIRDNIGLGSITELNDVKSYLNQEEAKTVLIAENDAPMREKNTIFTEMALQDLEKDYIIVSVPSEEEAYDTLGRDGSPDIGLNILCTDVKMKNPRGGLDLARYAYENSNHVVIHTTRHTLETNYNSTKINEEMPYIDQEYFKAGNGQDLVEIQDYKEMLNNGI